MDDPEIAASVVKPGDPAPDVSLPYADREGTLSLSGAWRTGPVLLALFRGLYCPFCRQQMAQLGPMADRLAREGVSTVGVVATAAERARLYFRFRPSRYPLGADPDLRTHRAFRLPRLPMTPEIQAMVEAAALERARQLGLPAEPGRAHAALDRWDDFTPLPSDTAEFDRHQAQLIGQFLIGTDGVVRWAVLEHAVGHFPGEEELLAAARTVT